jgi:RNA polymerase sigma factor (sigma-70 family)
MTPHRAEARDPPVNLTSQSLLDRLRSARPDAPDWRRLQELYLPLIRAWLSRVPVVGDEVNDLSQEVLLVVIRELPTFQRQRDGAFRAWLRQITVNRLRAFHRARHRQPVAGRGDETDRLLSQLEDPSSNFSQQWDREHDRHVFERLLAAVKPDFEARTWEAFTRFALEGRPASVVAEELGITENAVVVAKYRILKRLREEAAGLID